MVAAKTHGYADRGYCPLVDCYQINHLHSWFSLNKSKATLVNQTEYLTPPTLCCFCYFCPPTWSADPLILLPYGQFWLDQGTSSIKTNHVSLTFLFLLVVADLNLRGRKNKNSAQNPPSGSTFAKNDKTLSVRWQELVADFFVIIVYHGSWNGPCCPSLHEP